MPSREAKVIELKAPLELQGSGVGTGRLGCFAREAVP